MLTHETHDGFNQTRKTERTKLTPVWWISSIVEIKDIEVAADRPRTRSFGSFEISLGTSWPNFKAKALAVYGPSSVLTSLNWILYTPTSENDNRREEEIPNGSVGAQRAVMASNSSPNGSRYSVLSVPPHPTGTGLYAAGRAVDMITRPRILSIASESQ